MTRTFRNFIHVSPFLMLMIYAPAAVAQEATNAGERLFEDACGQCHAVTQGENGLGPHLHDVVGREAAGVQDYNYSNAMSEADITWTRENIDAFIENPLSFLQGTKMAFTGLGSEEDREVIIDFLAAHSEDEGPNGQDAQDAGDSSPDSAQEAQTD